MPVEQTTQKSAYQSLLEAATMQSVPKISFYSLSIFFLFLNSNLTTVKSQICKTNGGPSSFKKCVIPFKWNGKTYNKCPPDLEKPEKFWCSTKVDTNGVHIPKIGKFFSESAIRFSNLQNKITNWKLKFEIPTHNNEPLIQILSSGK
mgnify:CR=1 FL=1